MTPDTDTDEAAELAEDVVDQFSDHLDLSVEEVAEKIRSLADEYKMPASEAVRSAKNHYKKQADIEEDDLEDASGGNSEVLVGEINEDEQWVDVTVTVVDLWEPNSDKIAQVGLVGDESGRIKFVSFETSDLPELDEGQSYELSNVVTDEYQGDYSIKLNRTTGIKPIDEEIEVGDNSETRTGAIIDIQDGSGLIERCPADGCTRTVTNDRCSEHGEVDGEHDLRIKAVVDDGQTAETAIFNADMTEELTGIDLSEAEEMARDALDKSVVADEMESEIIGQYITVTGPMLGSDENKIHLVNSFDTTPEQRDASAIVAKARSI